MSDNLVKIEKSLQPLVNKFDESNLPRKGDIVFNFIDEKPMRVALKPNRKTSIHRSLSKEAPQVEISGDLEHILAILEGKKDPRKAFLEGSITVRGNLIYFQMILRSLKLMR